MPIWRRNLYILMVSEFLVLSAMTMIIPFLPLYLRDLGMKDPVENQLWAGVIYGANFLTAFLMAPIWGTLADRYGRKVMVLRSGFGMAVVIMLTGLATSPLQLLLLRLLNGTVSGFVPASISLTATNTPKDRVGYALGLLQSGAVAGSIMGPFIGGVLAEIIGGYRVIFFLTGLLLGLATLVVLLAVKEEKRPDPTNESASFWSEGSSILHQRPLVILFSVGFLVQFAVMGPMPQMPLYVLQLGAPGGYVAFFSGLVTAATGLANMISSPVLGRLGDRYGSEKVLFFAMIGAAVIFIPHAWVTQVWQLLLLRFVLGLCVGGLLPSLNTLVRRFAPEGKESTVYGYSTSAVNLGNMLGPVTCGYLSGWFHIHGLFYVTAVLLFLGAWWLKTGLRSALTVSRDSSVEQHTTEKHVHPVR